MHSKQSNQDSPKEGWQAETVKNHGNRQVWPVGAEERDVCVILEGVIRGVMGTGSPSDNNLDHKWERDRQVQQELQTQVSQGAAPQDTAQFLAGFVALEPCLLPTLFHSLPNPR